MDTLNVDNLRPTILIVDDQIENIQVLTLALERHGYSITYALSGKETFERLQAIQPDLILLDLFMPDMDGLQVCEAIKANPNYQEMPILFLTASHDEENLLNAFEKGAADYVTKPFKTTELLARVRTQIKLTQQGKELKQHRDKLDAILTHIKDGILVIDKTRNIVFANPASCQMLNQPLANLLGQQFDRLVADKNTNQIDIVRANGESGQAEITVSETQWGNQIVSIVSLRDVTERHQAELDMKKALEKERELNELRARFVSMVSHEFRTPLTTIQSSAILLERYDEKYSEGKRQNHFIRIQSSIRRMTQLLDDILTIGKAEAGKLEFHPEPIELVDFCQQIVESMRAFIRYRYINTADRHSLAFTVYGDSANVQMDENLLEHILTNLLSNAIKYSPDGGNIQLDLICESSSAMFRIQDQGIGIANKDLEKLFEPFGRASNVGSIQGTGLGLAIVKRCVELHGGTIEVDSKLDVGTTFIVTLPLNRMLSLNAS